MLDGKREREGIVSRLTFSKDRHAGDAGEIVHDADQRESAEVPGGEEARLARADLHEKIAALVKEIRGPRQNSPDYGEAVRAAVKCSSGFPAYLPL